MKFTIIIDCILTTVILILLWGTIPAGDITLLAFSWRIIVSAIIGYSSFSKTATALPVRIFKTILSIFDAISRLIGQLFAAINSGSEQLFAWGIGTAPSVLDAIGKRVGDIIPEIPRYNSTDNTGDSSKTSPQQALFNIAGAARRLFQKSDRLLMVAITFNHLFSIVCGAHLSCDHHYILFALLIIWTIWSTWFLWASTSACTSVSQILYITFAAIINAGSAVAEFYNMPASSANPAIEWRIAFTINILGNTITISRIFIIYSAFLAMALACFAQACAQLSRAGGYQCLLEDCSLNQVPASHTLCDNCIYYRGEHCPLTKIFSEEDAQLQISAVTPEQPSGEE